MGGADDVLSGYALQGGQHRCTGAALRIRSHPALDELAQELGAGASIAGVGLRVVGRLGDGFWEAWDKGSRVVLQAPHLV